MSDSSSHLQSDAAGDDSIRALARPIIATTAAWTLGYSSIFGQPQLLGPIMRELQIGETAGGEMFSFENAAFFITMFLVASPMAHWSRGRAALVAGLIGGAANLASGFTASFDALMVTRLIAGVGFGVMAAAGTASAASSANPSRVFTISSFAWGTGTAIQQYVLPYATAPYGFAGGYFLFAATSLPLMAAFVWLITPNHPPGLRLTLRGAPNRTLALWVMAALFIYEIGQTGVFTFAGLIGKNAGLDEFAVGEVLGWTRLAGQCGGILAIWVGSLAWRRWPVWVGLASNVTAVTGLALCTEETLYTIFNLMWTCGYYFAIPLVMAALARLDKFGRWAVAIDASWNGGTFAAPVLGGWLIETGGYGPLAGLSAVTGLIALVIMAGVLKRMGAGDV